MLDGRQRLVPRGRIFGLLLLGLASLTLLAYLPALRSGYIWDDDLWITENLTLRTLHGLKQIWTDLEAVPEYYPLTLTSFWVEYQLWGLHPFGYHLNNVLMHIVNALLVGLLLDRLKVPGAWLAAAVFALHPVHVESVAWATERKNTLSCLLSLLSVMTFLRAVPPDQQSLRSDRTRRGYYALSLALYMAAVFAKTVAVTLPAVLFLILWWKRPRLRTSDVATTVPYLLIGLPLGLLAIWMQKHHTGATGPEFEFTFVERCLIAGRAWWFYVGKLLWPVNLTFIYPKWDIDAGDWRQHVWPLAAAAAFGSLWILRHRIGRGPLVATLCFTATLLPGLGFFKIYWHRFSFVADHVQYVASIPMIAVFAAATIAIVIRISLSKPVSAAALVALLALLSVSVWRQSSIYHDAVTLWRATAQRNPDSWMVHACLGQALAVQKKYDESMWHYDRSLQLAPHLPEAHIRVGLGLSQFGRYEEAAERYLQALRLDPEYPPVHYRLGNAFLGMNRHDEAIASYRRAITLDPLYVEPHYNLGVVLERQGKIEAAIGQYEHVLRLRPHHADALYNSANCLLRRRAFPEAIARYEQLLESQPDHAEAHANLATALLASGRTREAMDHYAAALRIKPDLTPARRGLEAAKKLR